MDLTNLDLKQVALLAVMATLISTLVAATTAVTVAVINLWNARRMARDAARRDYRREMLKPLLEVAGRSTFDFHRVYSEIEKGRKDEASRLVIEMGREQFLFKTTSFTSVAASDDRLNAAAKSFSEVYAKAFDDCGAQLALLAQGGGMMPEGHGKAHVERVFDGAYHLHLEAEDFICGTRRSRTYLRHLEKRKALAP